MVAYICNDCEKLFGGYNEKRLRTKAAKHEEKTGHTMRRYPPE